jgi:hypothetical protein
LACLTVLLATCNDVFGPARAIVLPISEIEAPAEVGVGETLVVRVSIESGGCRSFKTLDAVRTADRVTFTARGVDTSGPRISCPGDIRTTIREYRAVPPLTDPFTLVARQPQGEQTTRTVRVR